MKNLRIACIGEAMLELVAEAVPGTTKIGFAGDTLNTAIYLRRLLPKEHGVAFVTVVGEDSLSTQFLEYMRSEGLDTRSVGRDRERLMGLYAIEKDPQGDRQFHYWRSNSAAKGLFDVQGQSDLSDLNGFDVVYLSAITLAILKEEVRDALLSWLSAFRSNGGLVVFDSNYRRQLWSDLGLARETIHKAWNATDVALPSLEDELTVFAEAGQNEVLERFRTYSPSALVLKRGALGPLSAEGLAVGLVRHEVNVVDTTGAGDSFNAGFLADWLFSRNICSAMQFGHEIACRVVANQGAIIPKVIWDENR